MNPRAAKDYALIGGRFRGYLLRKNDPHPTCDMLRISEADWEQMRQRERRERRSRIASLLKRYGSHAALERATSALSALRREWRGLPEAHRRDRSAWISERLRRSGISLQPGWHPELYEQTVEEWVVNAPPLCPYGLILQGQWIALRENLGFDDTAEDRFIEEVISTSAQSSWLTVIDCHC